MYVENKACYPKLFITEQPPLIEGDIIDDDDTRIKIEIAKTGGAAYDALNGGKWPGGVVPYKFGSVGTWYIVCEKFLRLMM